MAKYEASPKTPSTTAARPSRSRRRIMGRSIAFRRPARGSTARRRELFAALSARPGFARNSAGNRSARLLRRGRRRPRRVAHRPRRLVTADRITHERAERLVALDVAEHQLQVFVNGGIDQQRSERALTRTDIRDDL